MTDIPNRIQLLQQKVERLRQMADLVSADAASPSGPDSAIHADARARLEGTVAALSEVFQTVEEVREELLHILTELGGGPDADDRSRH